MGESRELFSYCHTEICENRRRGGVSFFADVLLISIESPTLNYATIMLQLFLHLLFNFYLQDSILIIINQ